MSKSANNHQFTIKIVIAMILGMLIGLLLQWLPVSTETRSFLADDMLNTAGTLFIRLIMMLVVPIVLVSLICGVGSIGDSAKIGRIAGKSFVLYLLTTSVAIALAMIFAAFFQVGHDLALTSTNSMITQSPSNLSMTETLLNVVPSNPFEALADANLLQVIVFALLFGFALTRSGSAGLKLLEVFQLVNDVLMKLITLIMYLAPYGVFCLLASLFASQGITLIANLAGYFLVVLLVLMVQLLGTYTLLLQLVGRLSSITFFKKMFDIMIFSFSISSSNASIPIVLKAVRERLGVDKITASFVIPVGATMNMDGTAIMQGVATVFIANAYNLPLSLSNYLIVIMMATLASIGTAGVPGVGLITLAMVLQQVGLPVEGIALIVGVDRLLDMTRTAVNVSGDSVIACLVARSENTLNVTQYNAPRLG